MKRLKRMILAVLVLCAIQMPITAAATSTEAQTGTQPERQTETGNQTEPQTETENDRVGGSYNSKQTFGIDQEFDKLSGNAKYLGSRYRDNYQLDLEKTGITEFLDAGINAAANVIFGMLQFLAMLVCAIVYFCLDFSLADALSKFIGTLQSGLINGVYKQLWLFAVVIMGFYTVGRIVKREFAEVSKDFCLVIFISALSIGMVSHSDQILTFSSNLTKSISTTIFEGLDSATGMSGEGSGSYAATAAGSLWADMIHEPWLTLEFGSADVDEAVVEEILSLPIGSKDRKDLVEDINKETGCFDKSRGLARLAMILIYCVAFVLKAGVFMFTALLQFLGQFLAVFVLLLAAFVLALAIIPSYGVGIIQKWLEKFFDVHISMILLSFLMGLMIWLNKVLYSFAGTFGWFLSLVFQAAVSLLLFTNYRTILFMVLHPRNGMSDFSRLIRQMQHQKLGNYRRSEKGLDDGRGGGSGDAQDFGEEDDYEDGYEHDYEGSVNERQVYMPGNGWGANGGNSHPVYDYEYPKERREHPGNEAPDHSYTEKESGLESCQRTDYEAMKDAPTQQEMYQMFHGEETEEAGAEEAVERENERPAEHLADGAAETRRTAIPLEVWQGAAEADDREDRDLSEGNNMPENSSTQGHLKEPIQPAEGYKDTEPEEIEAGETEETEEATEARQVYLEQIEKESIPAAKPERLHIEEETEQTPKTNIEQPAAEEWGKKKVYALQESEVPENRKPAQVMQEKPVIPEIRETQEQKETQKAQEKQEMQEKPAAPAEEIPEEVNTDEEEFVTEEEFR